MKNIESGGAESPNGNRRRLVSRNRSSRFWLSTLAIAAVIVFSFVVGVPGRNQSAMAAVQRSLTVAAQPVTRKYRLQTRYRPNAEELFRVDSELYVRGSERFAISHPGILPGTRVWLGRDGDRSWVVPAFGPVMQGGDAILRRFLRSRDDLETPYLHIETILKRMMSRGYQLSNLTDEQLSIPNGNVINCRHIRAELEAWDDPSLPRTIDLWTSHESGMAVRLVADWNLQAGQAGRDAVVIVFEQVEPTLSNDWFRAEAHLDR